MSHVEVMVCPKNLIRLFKHLNPLMSVWAIVLLKSAPLVLVSTTKVFAVKAEIGFLTWGSGWGIGGCRRTMRKRHCDPLTLATWCCPLISYKHFLHHRGPFQNWEGKGKKMGFISKCWKQKSACRYKKVKHETLNILRLEKNAWKH